MSQSHAHPLTHLCWCPNPVQFVLKALDELVPAVPLGWNPLNHGSGRVTCGCVDPGGQPRRHDGLEWRVVPTLRRFAAEQWDGGVPPVVELYGHPKALSSSELSKAMPPLLPEK